MLSHLTCLVRLKLTQVRLRIQAKSACKGQHMIFDDRDVMLNH